MYESKIVIVGAGGQLGRALSSRLPKAVALGREQLDVTSEQSVLAYDWGEVSVIINAAAYTKVDEAETPEGRRAAWRANATAVALLARVAVKHDITLVHVSSEYVFDGEQHDYPEDAPFGPLGVYGASKAAGDIAAMVVPKHYIIRTTWVIGDGHNFVRTMMNLAKKDVSPTVVSDQIGRLTFTSTIVDAITTLLRTEAPFGTYNVTNSGEPASWADVTRAVFAALDRSDLVVTNVSTADYFADKPQAAKRPLNSTLSLSKIIAAGVQLPDWRDGLTDYIQQNKE